MGALRHWGKCEPQGGGLRVLISLGIFSEQVLGAANGQLWNGVLVEWVGAPASGEGEEVEVDRDGLMAATAATLWALVRQRLSSISFHSV
jgi:hypothetical protein